MYGRSYEDPDGHIWEVMWMDPAAAAGGTGAAAMSKAPWENGPLDPAETNELSVTRFIAAPPEVVYRVFTTRTGEWWAPKPYTTPGVEFDLRPGGIARTDMQAPDGTPHPNQGVFLEVVPNRKLVTTDAFRVGWVPAPAFMVAIFTFEPEGTGTRYTASARHWSAETRKSHEEMGFVAGLGHLRGTARGTCRSRAKA